MIDGKKVVVVLPAYNAERTLERSFRAIARNVVDEVILVDDKSDDQTVDVARRLDIACHEHTTNLGYGANQKTCYQAALDQEADIVVMLHPDYQYPPELIPALAGLVASGLFHVVLGSRMLGRGAMSRGMPLYKYVSNRLWTCGQNLLLSRRLSEYHTGYRAFSREFLLRIPLLENSNDFLFDNQVLVQAVFFGYEIGEVSTPSHYAADSSTINPWRGAWYGLGVVATTLQYLLQKMGLARWPIFDLQGRRLTDHKPGALV